jgi:hypothetical protein
MSIAKTHKDVRQPFSRRCAEVPLAAYRLPEPSLCITMRLARLTLLSIDRWPLCGPCSPCRMSLSIGSRYAARAPLDLLGYRQVAATRQLSSYRLKRTSPLTTDSETSSFSSKITRSARFPSSIDPRSRSTPAARAGTTEAIAIAS